MLKVETGLSTGLTSTGCGLASKLLATWTLYLCHWKWAGSSATWHFSQSFDVLSRRAGSYEAYAIVSEVYT